MTNSPVATFVILGLIVAVLVTSYLVPRRKRKSELGKVALYEEQCPGTQKLRFWLRYGSAISNWRIALYEDSFVLASLVVVSIRYTEVVSIAYKEGLLSSRLHIQTHNPKIDVILMPGNPQKILDIFLEKNVRASKPSHQAVRLMKVLRFCFMSVLVVVFVVVTVLVVRAAKY